VALMLCAKSRNGLFFGSVMAMKWYLRNLPPPAFSSASAAVSAWNSVSAVPPDFEITTNRVVFRSKDAIASRQLQGSGLSWKVTRGEPPVLAIAARHLPRQSRSLELARRDGVLR